MWESPFSQITSYRGEYIKIFYDDGLMRDMSEQVQCQFCTNIIDTIIQMDEDDDDDYY